MANNHKANQSNSNKGTNGVNKTYSKNQGNRGKQLKKWSGRRDSNSRQSAWKAEALAN